MADISQGQRGGSPVEHGRAWCVCYRGNSCGRRQVPGPGRPVCIATWGSGCGSTTESDDGEWNLGCTVEFTITRS